MCIQYIKLKTKNEYGTKYGYMPCGKCVDCRKKMQNAWKFRLNSEFQDLKKRKGWNVGFVTLTYNDSNKPIIPKCVFEDDKQYRAIACFNKKDVRDFVLKLRQYCKYHYDFKNGDNMRYFIASEYGDITKRPHYHMIIAWPSRVSYEVMHGLIKKFWKNSKGDDLGMVFPRDYRGDHNGYRDCKPFEIVGDISKALTYVSKYVCKDLSFINECKDIKFFENMRLYQNCQPFHMQSQSLGYEVIKNMSDEEKREVLINGMSLQGDGELYQIPLYIKNKIVFDNYYVIDEKGKRLVKRKASEFFEKYSQEMFEEKAKFYTKFFAESSSAQYYVDRGVDEKMAECFASSLDYYAKCVNCFINDSLYTDNVIGKLYLAYFGVRKDRCYDIDLVDQWMARYRVNFDNTNLPIANQSMLDYVNNYCSLVLGCNQFVNISKRQEREDEEHRLDRIRDFYNNVLEKQLVW